MVRNLLSRPIYTIVSIGRGKKVHKMLENLIDGFRQPVDGKEVASCQQKYLVDFQNLLSTSLLEDGSTSRNNLKRLFAT